MNDTLESLKLDSSKEDITGWKRYLYFYYEGVYHEAALYWDEWEGYEIVFDETPDWFDNLDVDQQYNLYVKLDELSSNN